MAHTKQFRSNPQQQNKTKLSVTILVQCAKAPRCINITEPSSAILLVRRTEIPIRQNEINKDLLLNSTIHSKIECYPILVQAILVPLKTDYAFLSPSLYRFRFAPVLC